jgi:hypothetical protein
VRHTRTGSEAERGNVAKVAFAARATARRVRPGGVPVAQDLVKSTGDDGARIVWGRRDEGGARREEEMYDFEVGGHGGDLQSGK